MNVQIVQQPPIPVVMIRHTGSYDDLEQEFERLYNWVVSNNIPVQRTIGMFYDNPDYTPKNRLRSAACFEVAVGYQPQGLTSGIEFGEVPGAQYATMRYIGPYDQMEPVWSSFTNHIEKNLNRRISEDIPALEIYVNDPETTPPQQLITDLYMPVI